MQEENLETFRYKFVFVIDGDVGMTLILNPHEDQLKRTTCLRNNPEIVEVEPNAGDIAKFNFVNGGVVNYTLDFPDSPTYERYIACLRSNPTIMEVPLTHPVRSGWTYDGTDFLPPV